MDDRLGVRFLGELADCSTQEEGAEHARSGKRSSEVVCDQGAHLAPDEVELEMTPHVALESDSSPEQPRRKNPQAVKYA
jgi:hypothetical protein